jgi:hypothetical protein
LACRLLRDAALDKISRAHRAQLAARIIPTSILRLHLAMAR